MLTLNTTFFFLFRIYGVISAVFHKFARIFADSKLIKFSSIELNKNKQFRLVRDLSRDFLSKK